MKPRNIEGKFSQYLLKSRAFVEEFYRNGHGIVADLWTTRFDEMKFINIAIPSFSEQQTIALFLDEKTAKIDQTISIKEKEILLLKERRQILIQKAVTKGLNPKVKLKNSGVDWIGEIPEHWEVRKLKFIFDFIKTGTTPPTANQKYFDGNIINEDKLGFITEELKCFCPSPFFWDIPLEEYMKKWVRLYFPNL